MKVAMPIFLSVSQLLEANNCNSAVHMISWSIWESLLALVLDFFCC